MQLVISFVLLLSITSVCANEESVEWISINTKVNDAKVEVSRYYVDNVDWPIVYMWVRITFSLPNEAGDYGEIQEWWMNCNEFKGETITYRIYKTKEMNLGNWSELGHFQKNIDNAIIREVCKLFEVKKST